MTELLNSLRRAVSIMDNNLNDFLAFLNQAVSPYHVVNSCIERLERAGFECLTFARPWNLEKGGSYYLKLYDTTLFAFKVGFNIDDEISLRIAAAHTDFPALRIKPNPLMKENGYLRLNTEVYGGMLLSSWYDRPLSIAGKVALRSSHSFEPEEALIDFGRAIAVIPNLAIHLNKETDRGAQINKQTDILPLLALTENPRGDYFQQLLAEQLKVKAEDILAYDLYIYCGEKALTAGINNEFICSPRLDDLSSVYALLQGITSSKVGERDIHMICLFDNEEIGNRTKQGAASQFTQVLLEKIFAGLNQSKFKLYEAMLRSIMLSCDAAHAYHPNFAHKYDPTNRLELNQGMAIKIDTARYAFDMGAVAVIQQLCNKYGINYQKFVNRSDVTAGSTMGPVLSSLLPIRTIDIGIPLLAMHSAVETMGSKDEGDMIKFMQAFFSASR